MRGGGRQVVGRRKVCSVCERAVGNGLLCAGSSGGREGRREGMVAGGDGVVGKQAGDGRERKVVEEVGRR